MTFRPQRLTPGSLLHLRDPGDFPLRPLPAALAGGFHTARTNLRGKRLARSPAAALRLGAAPLARVPLADGTLVATAEIRSDDLIHSLLATSDVLGTGWYAADAARVQPGSTVVVVGASATRLPNSSPPAASCGRARRGSGGRRRARSGGRRTQCRVGAPAAASSRRSAVRWRGSGRSWRECSRP